MKVDINAGKQADDKLAELQRQHEQLLCDMTMLKLQVAASKPVQLSYDNAATSSYNASKNDSLADDAALSKRARKKARIEAKKAATAQTTLAQTMASPNPQPKPPPYPEKIATGKRRHRLGIRRTPQETHDLHARHAGQQQANYARWQSKRNGTT